PFFAKSDREVVKKFNEAYRHRYGMNPDFLAAQGFDVGTLVVAALRRSRQSGESFSKALTSIEAYDGLTGKIWVGPDGEMNRIFQVVEIQGGRLVSVPFSQPNSPGEPSYVGRGDRVVRAPISRSGFSGREEGARAQYSFSQ
ncbi:MAG: ABC transporter substrate-binding protein, partial [Bdellovibrionales bacterium]|nr:ABC transporter substrate-binding protein [Bdellovibrionales bacterium]